MDLNQDIVREWNRAILVDSCCLSNKHVNKFKEKYPDYFRYFHSFYRLRHEINADLRLLSFLGYSIQWFTLTFDNKRDKALVSSKRKSATRFLNDIFLFYEMVEEYGEDKGRYHIHGFGVYRINRSFNDFIKWPCRNKIECLTTDKLKKKVKYLTKYAVKSLPRIRRSKNLCAIRKNNKNSFRVAFPSLWLDDMKSFIDTLS